MHLQAQRWLCLMAATYPHYFIDRSVNDIGSAAIAGTNRYLFNKSSYIGFDIMEYKNVDCVFDGKNIPISADTTICTEVLEHTPDYKELVKSMVETTEECLLITCASTGRREHGTFRTTPKGSPFSKIIYYKNLTIEDIEPLVKGEFAYIEFFSGNNGQDLYVLCIKNEPKVNPNRLTFILLFTYRFFLNRLHDYAEFFKRIKQRFSKQ